MLKSPPVKKSSHNAVKFSSWLLVTFSALLSSPTIHRILISSFPFLKIYTSMALCIILWFIYWRLGSFIIYHIWGKRLGYSVENIAVAPQAIAEKDALSFLSFLFLVFIPIYLPLNWHLVQNHFIEYYNRIEYKLFLIFIMLAGNLLFKLIIFKAVAKGVAKKESSIGDSTISKYGSTKNSGIACGATAEKKWTILLLSFLFIYILIFAILGIRYYELMRIDADFLVFQQAFFNTMRGKLLTLSLMSKNEISAFAEHNSPILFAIIPIYWLFPSTRVLMTLNSIIIAAGGLAFYFFCRKILKFPNLATILLTAAFILYPFIVTHHFAGLHMETFAPLFIILAFYQYYRHNFYNFILIFLLLLTVKEDLAFFTIFFPVLAVCHRRSLKWIVVPLIISSIWLFFTFGILFPHFAQGKSMKLLSYEYGEQANSPINLIFYLISHPCILFQKIADPIRSSYLYLIFAPLAFILPFFSPVIIFALFGLAMNVFLIKWAPNILTHHSLMLSTFLFISLALSLDWLVKNVKFINCLRCYRKNYNVVVLNIISAFLLQLTFGFMPAWARYIDLRADPQLQIREQAVSLIPPEASVASYPHLMAPLANSNLLYLITISDKVVDPPVEVDYLIIDTTLFRDKYNYEDFIAKVHQNNDWYENYHLFWHKASIYLFKRESKTN